MEDNRKKETKVVFSNEKNFDSHQPSQKTKIAVFCVLTAVLFLGAVVSTSVYFSIKKRTPTRLAELNLEDGETLTYRVDQHIEIKGSDVQNAIIRATVGIRVLNKTSEEYWFLIKFHLSRVGGNAAERDVNIMIEYFLIRFQIASRTPNEASNDTGESFEVYGPRRIKTELLRQVYGILELLLPTVKRDLYEEVDGEKVISWNSEPDPEESPLLPGPVRMHREANTSAKDTVLIRNHFDRTDFVNLSSDIDLDLKYSDSAYINKSNGMVTKSRAYFSEQLNFGEPILENTGSDVKMMKVTLTSQVSLIELTDFFGEAESQSISVHFFVKLVLQKSKATFSVKDKPSNESTDADSNPTQPSSKTPSPIQQHNNTTWSNIPLKRSRRAVNLNINLPFTLFEKKMIGINVKAEGRLWYYSGLGISFGLKIGSIHLPDIISERFAPNQLQGGRDVPGVTISWGRGLSIEYPVFFLTIGIGFSLNFNLNTKLLFPGGNSVEIQPSADVTASIQAHISAWVIRGGVYGDGTLVRVGLPVTLSYQENRGGKWCLALSARLTALELSAGIFYQWRCFSFWRGLYWCPRRNLLTFGTWAALRKNWRVLESCG